MRKIVVNVEFEKIITCQKSFEIIVDDSDYKDEGDEFSEEDYQDWARQSAEEEAERRIHKMFEDGTLEVDFQDDEELGYIDCIAE